jgi:hypothetical protein
MGSILDFAWNYLVLHFTISRLKSYKGTPSDDSSPDKYTSNRRQFICTIFITIIGFVIDFLYYNISWGEILGVAPHILAHPIFPRMGANKALELISMLEPMAAIALTTFILSRLFFRLKTGQAVILGTVMGFLTAPWLIIAVILRRP